MGTALILRKWTTVRHLVEVIQTVMNDRPMRQRAADLGAKIRTEDGVANAVVIIKKLELTITKTPVRESFPLT